MAKSKVRFAVLTDQDIREIQHAMVARRTERRAMRAKFREEIAQEQAFRALVREQRQELDGSLTDTADVLEEDAA